MARNTPNAEELKGFLSRLDALAVEIKEEQEDAITGVIDHLDSLQTLIEQKQESLSWTVKRLTDTRLAAVAKQRAQVEQLVSGGADATGFVLEPCATRHFACVPEIAEAKQALESLGYAAAKFYQLAAERSDEEAHQWLGVQYQTGETVTQNMAEAVRQFELAAKAGSIDAQFSLACRYLNGEGVARDQATGLRMLVQAAEAGHSDAANALATRHVTGDGVPADKQKAIALFKTAADRQHRVAAYNLATCYYNGDGVGQDNVAAAKYYRQAADAGLARAQVLLAELYELGEGVPQDIEIAKKYWRLAADSGDADAQNALAETLIQQGSQNAVSWDEATKYLLMAAEQGHCDAQYNLGEVLLTSSDKADLHAVSTAVRWFQNAADQGHVLATYNLGVCHKHGQGVLQDQIQATRFFEMAARAGHAPSQYALAWRFYKGEGAAADLARAKEMFSTAANQGHEESMKARAQFDELTSLYHQSDSGKGSDGAHEAAPNAATAEPAVDDEDNEDDLLASIVGQSGSDSEEEAPPAAEKTGFHSGVSADRESQLGPLTDSILQDVSSSAAATTANSEEEDLLSSVLGHEPMTDSNDDGAEQQTASTTADYTAVSEDRRSKLDSLTDSLLEDAGNSVPINTDDELGASDVKMWGVIKADPWGKQLAKLQSCGWVEPVPEFDGADEILGQRMFVMEHGFGILAKITRKKRGWSPASVEFKEGGKKTIILRVKGKEMGTPFLYAPPSVGPFEFNEPEPEPVVAPLPPGLQSKVSPALIAKDKSDWETLQKKGWGQQLQFLNAEGWTEPAPDYDGAEDLVGERVFVMEHGFGVLVKVNKKKRGWGPSSIEFHEGGKKIIILRLKGKEMGTPFLYAGPGGAAPAADDSPASFLAKISVFGSASPSDVQAIADAVEETQFEKGDYIIRQGYAEQAVFFLLEGTADAVLADTASTAEMVVCSYSPGDFFGELSWATGDRRAANVVATSADAKCLKLPSSHLSLLDTHTDAFRAKQSGYVNPFTGASNDSAQTHFENSKKQEQDLIDSLLQHNESSDDENGSGLAFKSGDYDSSDDEGAGGLADLNIVARARSHSAIFQNAVSSMTESYSAARKSPRPDAVAELPAAQPVKPAKKERRKRNEVVMGRVIHIDENFELPVVAKSFQEQAWLQDTIRKMDIFEHLKDAQVSDLVSCMNAVTVPANEVFVNQGDRGDKCYIIEYGSFDCIISKTKKSFFQASMGKESLRDKFDRQDVSKTGALSSVSLAALLKEIGCNAAEADMGAFFSEMDVTNSGTIGYEDFYRWWKVPISLNVATLTKDAYFGELALLYDSPRAASLVAAEEAKVWAVDIQSFKFIVVAGNSAITTKIKKTLAKVELFKKLREAELVRMAEAMKEVVFSQGESIIKQGEEVDDSSMFYIIEAGKAEVTLDDGSLKGIFLGPGQYFGDAAILENKPRNASITATSEVSCLGLTRLDFNRILGSLKDILAFRKYEGQTCRKEPTPAKRRRNSVTMDISGKQIDFAGQELTLDDFEKVRRQPPSSAARCLPSRASPAARFLQAARCRHVLGSESMF